MSGLFAREAWMLARLNESDPYARLQALLLLVRCSPSPGIVQAVLDRLQDIDVEVRQLAVSVLTEIATGDVGTLSGLCDALSDNDAIVRRRAAAALEHFGPQAELAIPDLLRLLDDPSDSVRRQAASTLGAIGPSARLAASRLRDMVHDCDCKNRAVALVALRRVEDVPSVA